MSNRPVIFVIGGPGSGKGTQCELIVKKYGFTHLSTGDLLRDEVNSGSEKGQNLNQIMQSGRLVPLEDVLTLLKTAIKSNSSSKGFLIDGYPREVNQAILFEKEIKECDFLLYFKVNDNTMIQRLLNRGKTSGRIDDNEDTIKQRLHTFHKHNDLILNHFREKVEIILAETEPEEIFAQVCKCIETRTCLFN